jgi:hypothetical protein
MSIRANSVSDRSATGTLIQKIARQVQYSVRYEPATGPIAVNRPATMKKMASPLPRSSTGKAFSTSTVVDGISRAPPTPWRILKTISHASDASPSGVRPQRSEEPANTMIPMATIRLWPMTSPRRPPRAMNAAVESAYAVTIHCAPVAVRPRSRWIVVTEMLTIVKSIITIAMAGTSGQRTRYR